MKFRELPLHQRLIEFLDKEGVKELYPPQEEAVRRGFFSGKNLLMVTQTASGKTFLAELLAVNNALQGRGKTVYLTPLKALATEKHRDFQRYASLGIRTGITLGNYDKSDQFLESFDIIITTYEKMDSLLRHRPSWFRAVTTVIIDEIHYIDDPERGPVIESIVSNIKTHRRDIQLIGLSATIGNPDEISEWLNAELVESLWRPVPLREGVYFSGNIIYSNGYRKRVPQYYSNPVMDLTKDIINNGGQALVFVSSRRKAVTLAEKAAKSLMLPPTRESRELGEQVAGLTDVDTLNRLLKELISKRVSFHHAGLTVEQRRLIEEGFRKGVIKVIFSTPTLAAGVNLPARRVIIEEYRRYTYPEGSQPIKVLEYKQFAGRAGRPGLDEYGEAILIARNQSEVQKLYERYIMGEPEEVTSSFHLTRSLRMHLLAYISSHGRVHSRELLEYVKNTLAYKQVESRILPRVDNALTLLEDSGFIISDNNTYRPTPLGRRVSEVYVDPASAVVLLKAASKKERAYTDFGLIHLITATPDMILLSVKRRELDELDRLLDTYLPEMLLGFEDMEQSDYDRIYQEVKTTLLLLDWVNEENEQTITERYDIGPGDLRSIIETAEWIAYSFRRILEGTGINPRLVPLYAKMEMRIRYGVKSELLELVRIPNVGRVRARRLYNAGFRTLEDLAKASTQQLAKVDGIGKNVAQKIIESAKLVLSLR